jgi:hypothetical protein
MPFCKTPSRTAPRDGQGCSVTPTRWIVNVEGHFAAYSKARSEADALVAIAQAPAYMPRARRGPPTHRAVATAATIVRNLQDAADGHALGWACLDLPDAHFCCRGKAKDKVRVHACCGACTPLRVGDVIDARQACFTPHMMHPMLYMGGGMVAHFTRDTYTNGRVSLRHLNKQAAGGKLYPQDSRVFARVSGEQRMWRVRRAAAILGHWPYDMTLFSCEHVMRSVCGVPQSHRISSIPDATPIVLTLVLVMYLSAIFIGLYIVLPRLLSRRERRGDG